MGAKENFRSNLAYYMKRAGMNQIELAKAVGKSESAVSLWLSGGSCPRMGTVQDIADALLEMFREGCASQELTNAALLDAFVIRAEVRLSDILVYFRIKKEDRQTVADLPEPDEGCSYSSVKWTCGESIRTLYYINGYFMISIPA